MTTKTTTATKTAKSATNKPRSGKCLCGCGQDVTNNYRPGHDARHVSQCLDELFNAYMDGPRANMDLPDLEEDIFKALPTPALRSKLQKAYDRRTDQREAQAAKVAQAATKNL